jgi:hypothetical protein
MRSKRSTSASSPPVSQRAAISSWIDRTSNPRWASGCGPRRRRRSAPARLISSTSSMSSPSRSKPRDARSSRRMRSRLLRLIEATGAGVSRTDPRTSEVDPMSRRAGFTAACHWWRRPRTVLASHSEDEELPYIAVPHVLRRIGGLGVQTRDRVAEPLLQVPQKYHVARIGVAVEQCNLLAACQINCVRGWPPI